MRNEVVFFFGMMFFFSVFNISSHASHPKENHITNYTKEIQVGDKIETATQKRFKDITFLIFWVWFLGIFGMRWSLQKQQCKDLVCIPRTQMT